MDDDLMGRLVANAGRRVYGCGNGRQQRYAIPAQARAEQEVRFSARFKKLARETTGESAICESNGALPGRGRLL